MEISMILENENDYKMSMILKHGHFQDFEKMHDIGKTHGHFHNL